VLLSIAALGVVFGDIGTSPLYAFKLCFTNSGMIPTPQNVIGILSLITWALILVVCVKYASVMLRADNDGEGGTLALLAQLLPSSRIGIPAPLTAIAYMLLFAAGMVFGDGVITPAISVLSAVEGLGVALPAAEPFIVPVTVAVLIGLFFIQSRGAGRIGSFFGPIMMVWFVTIGIAGAIAIAHAPAVLVAFNPFYALGFIAHNRLAAILILGAVVLCVTGVEAMFADLAHFGRRAIWLAWYGVAFPALLLNYYGQAALTLVDVAALKNPFFLLFPLWATLPVTVLATAATVIASQALITGAFSLTQQAVQLGYLPRLQVRHTSHEVEGQIFMPLVNTLLALSCLALVLLFQSSSHLGAAYGLAVTVTMLADSIAIGFVLHKRFKWNIAQIVPLVMLFLIVDLAFLVGNVPKFLQGGYIPVGIALLIFTLFTTWTAGRRKLAIALAALATPIEDFIREVRDTPASDADGTAIFLTPHTDGVPFVLRHHWLKTRMLREEVVLLTLVTKRRPYVDPSARVTVEQIVPRLTRITASYGFMETPDVRDILPQCQKQIPREIDLLDADYFFARPRVTHSGLNGYHFPAWRRWLLKYMMRNANPLTDSLGIEPDRIIEFGIALEV
jgi:KUP system potassium uptake protein